MRTIQREIVAGLVVSKDGKFLFGMKDPEGGGVYAHCWHTPGGGIEEGENKLEALAREMQEEMGIDICRARAKASSLFSPSSIPPPGVCQQCA